MALTTTQLKTLRRAIPDRGNRVAVAMELLDVTQAEVASAIEVTQPYVSAVATGRHATITVENARKFADYFGCSIEDLFPAKAEVA
jgi:transcriptional regulator with XRE-family HTH domain